MTRSPLPSRILSVPALACILASCAQAPRPAEPSETAMTTRAAAASVLDFTMNSIDSEPIHLADRYAGKVLLIVNVASKCGYTPQYEQLQQLHERYHDRGLAVIGVPANNFGNQEPGTNADIAEFCNANYGVTFDMLSKVSVAGEDICPLYAMLTSDEASGEFSGDVKWNFEKFLISRDGRVVNRFRSKVAPDSPEVIEAIERELGS